jgi:type IX secretion system PorP/SprF family membrane protein
MKKMIEMKNSIVIIGLLLLMPMLGWSQQDPQYSLYMFNGLALNPAYAGSTAGIIAGINYRSQWLGVNGAPRTTTANIHGRYGQEKLGTGLFVSNDQIGIFKRNQIRMAQAYHLRLKKLIIGMGIQANYEQMSAGFASAHYNNGSGDVDNAFLADQTYSNLNFGAGLYVYNNKFWLGYSAPSLIRQEWSKTSLGNMSAYQSFHHYCTGGYVFNYGRKWTYKVMGLVKLHDSLTPSVDAGMMAYYGSTVGFGVSNRLNDAWIAMAEFQLGDYARIIYSFDYTSSFLKSYSNGTHELMIKFFLSSNYRGQVSPRLF